MAYIHYVFNYTNPWHKRMKVTSTIFCVPNDIKRLNYSFWFHFGGIATVHKFITILRSTSSRKFASELYAGVKSNATVIGSDTLRATGRYTIDGTKLLPLSSIESAAVSSVDSSVFVGVAGAFKRNACMMC